jgi:hypothetical protein
VLVQPLGGGYHCPDPCYQPELYTNPTKLDCPAAKADLCQHLDHFYLSGFYWTEVAYLLFDSLF